MYLSVIKCVVLLLSGVLFGYCIHRLLRILPIKIPGVAQKNLSVTGRVLRFTLGLALLIGNLFFWHPLIFVAAGFCFYEAFAKWCVLRAILGSNVCPL